MAVRNAAAIDASGPVALNPGRIDRVDTRKNGRVQAAKVRIVARKIRVAPHPRFAFRGSGIVSAASVVLKICYC